MKISCVTLKQTLQLNLSQHCIRLSPQYKSVLRSSFLGCHATFPLRALRDIPKATAKETNNITT